MMTRQFFLAALLLTSPVTLLEAQQTLDRGSFTITVNGQRTGREDFTINSTPAGRGTEYIASATISYGDRRASPVVRADSAGTAMQYQVELRSADASVERWTGTIERGRVNARTQTRRGQSEREFIVTNGAVVLDDDVFHQYYFVARKRSVGSVPVLIPRRNTQLQLRISSAGSDRVTIDGRELAAEHLVLTEAGGAVRDVWIDAQGRILRVAIPSRGLVATRDEPPA